MVPDADPDADPLAEGDSDLTLSEQARRRLPDQTITLVLGGAVVIALGLVMVIALFPGTEADAYTEFYVLGPDGNASDYPTSLTVGETGTVIVGIGNHEGRERTYTLRARLGERQLLARSLSLGAGERWQDELSFSPEQPGNMTLGLNLYRGSTATESGRPYREVRIVVNVTQAPTSAESQLPPSSEPILKHP